MNSVIIKIMFLILLVSSMNIWANSSSQQQVFIQEMAHKYDFEKMQLQHLFSKTKVSQEILQAIARPAEKLYWYQYRPIFIKQDRIDAGVTFWKEHQDTLHLAEDKFGVPAEIIVAIIGVETRYGKFKGKYRVFDALVTLSFHYPKRAAFFKSELEQFLLLTREYNIDPLSIYGSYAGAMGIPQFISSSYRHYAIDFDGDGKIDLINNESDAIGSVAHYFQKHGWKKGGAVIKNATVEGDGYKKVLEKGYKPELPFSAMKDYNVSTSESISPDQTVSLIELKQKARYDYWLALPNFYAITRYNHSPLYAMAVYQLSQAIKKSYMN